MSEKAIFWEGGPMLHMHEPKPARGFPPGRVRWIMRPNDWVKAAVRTADGIRIYIVKDAGDAWEPMPDCEQAAKRDAQRYGSEYGIDAMCDWLAVMPKWLQWAFYNQVAVNQVIKRLWYRGISEERIAWKLVEVLSAALRQVEENLGGAISRDPNPRLSAELLRSRGLKKHESAEVGGYRGGAPIYPACPACGAMNQLWGRYEDKIVCRTCGHSIPAADCVPSLEPRACEPREGKES